MQKLGKILHFFGELGKKRATKPALLLRLSIVLLGFAVLIFLAQLWNSSQPIKSISISGTSFLSPAEVKGAIEDASIINVPKNKIKYDRLASQLKNNPFIAETYMHEGIYSLNIEVVERNPAALIANNYGELQYVDKDANLLPYRIFRSIVDMPVITGAYDGDRLDSAKLVAAVGIINELKSSKYSFLYNFISEIHYNKKYESYELFTSDNGTKILFGNTDNLEGKLNNVYEFFQYKIGNIKDKKIKYIDARWSEQIIAKYENI